MLSVAGGELITAVEEAGQLVLSALEAKRFETPFDAEALRSFVRRSCS